MAITEDTIEFVVPPREPRTADPERRHALIQDNMDTFRRIFLEGLTHQIGLARDPDYTYPSHKRVEAEDESTADVVFEKEVVYEAPEPWWYEEDGVVFLRLNFGERTLHIPGKNPVIEVGGMDDLLPALEDLHIRVADGELDDVIEKMTIVSR